MDSVAKEIRLRPAQLVAQFGQTFAILRSLSTMILVVPWAQ